MSGRDPVGEAVEGNEITDGKGISVWPFLLLFVDALWLAYLVGYYRVNIISIFIAQIQIAIGYVISHPLIDAIVIATWPVICLNDRIAKLLPSMPAHFLLNIISSQVPTPRPTEAAP